MSKVLSLKMRDEVFREMEAILRRSNRPRNAYINDAVAFFNRAHRRRGLAREYERASLAAREESMRVLAEFEASADELDA